MCQTRSELAPWSEVKIDYLGGYDDLYGSPCLGLRDLTIYDKERIIKEYFPDTGTIYGKVVKTDGSPIEGASVETTDGRYATETSSAGIFSIWKVAPGSYELQISRFGTTGQFPITVSGNKVAHNKYELPLGGGYADPGGQCNGNLPCYSTVQEAINSAQSGSTIKLAQGEYSESYTLNESKKITIQGGWDSRFSIRQENRSATIIKAPIVKKGTIVLQNLTVRP